MQARDMKLLEGIEKHRYLRADHAAQLYFQSTIKKPEQQQSKARERLLMLYRNKLVDRARYPNEPYIYFTKGSPRSHKMNHYLAITEVLIKIIKQLPASSKIEYDIEVQHGEVITDLVIYYKNNFRKEEFTLYVEVELDSSADIEQKIRAYEESITDGVLIVVAKHPATIKRIKEIDTNLQVVGTSLDVNLGSMSFK